MRDEFLVRAGPKSRRSTTTSVRAVRAADATIAYARRCGTGTEELPTVFADFLSDAHHLADALGVDWEEATCNGEGHYTAELYGAE
ncbi:hypothetical protein A5N83_08550 [Rhodococcus sp. 1139]|nr:hypothetical protein A5N83_08550 [Rhodococcus sp. 1139]